MASKRVVNANTVTDELKRPTPKLLNQFKVTLLIKDGMVVTPKSRVVDVEYNKDYEKDLANLESYFAEIFGSASFDEKKKEITITGTSGSIKVNLKQKKPPGGKRETINTKVQEEGTTIVLNQVIHKNKKFDKKEDILADKDTADQLKKLFGKKYADRLEEWTHSYFEQQKEFLKKFQSAKWDIFVYGRDDFVTFFSEQIKSVARSLDPLRPVGDYTTWSPSDIWAVYDGNKVKEQIAKNINPKTQNLVELNNLLINLFNEKKLIGVSLKKIDAKQSANLKFVNIDTSTMRLGDIETYSMSQIKFDIDNIVKGETVTTYVKYGSGNDYSINISKAGSRKSASNLTFNTAIKATPAAQGGQAPVKMIVELLNRGASGITFLNNNKNYPTTSQEFSKRSAEFEKYYKVVKKHMSNSPNYSEFESLINSLYDNKDKKFIAQSKLMQLHFFHDALKNYSNKSEFWTDLLYLGMKVGDRFAPHAKIS